MGLVHAIFTEQNSYLSSGHYRLITYRCSKCSHTVTLPEQQGFRYCYLCGAKVGKIKSKSLTWNPLS